MSAWPVLEPVISPFDLLDTACLHCGSERLKGDTCGECGLCQRCGEFADHCRCEVSASARYEAADLQDWREFRWEKP